MARTTVVKAARKPQGKCRTCGVDINIGDPYKWAKPRYGAKAVVCGAHQITVSMTSSSKMVTIWEAQESFSPGSPEKAAEELRGLAETVREVGQEYQDSADNQREYFPDSDVAQENEDKAQELDGWADELESAADDIESLISEVDDLQTELAGLEDNEENQERREEIENEIEEKQEEATSKADEVAGECPV